MAEGKDTRALLNGPAGPEVQEIPDVNGRGRARSSMAWCSSLLSRCRSRKTVRVRDPRDGLGQGQCHLDKIGSRSASEDKHHHQYKTDTAAFSQVRSPKKQAYSIHPEWVSEKYANRLSYHERTQTYPPRKCRSTPPSYRNPITWEEGERKVSAQPLDATPRLSRARADEDHRRKFKSNVGFFKAIGSPKKQFYDINPEWVSENTTVRRLSMAERTKTYPPRRSKSAPPPSGRNPITWDGFG